MINILLGNKVLQITANILIYKSLLVAGIVIMTLVGLVFLGLLAIKVLKEDSDDSLEKDSGEKALKDREENGREVSYAEKPADQEEALL